jgi:flagellar P-ring protein precursor FlgI
MKRVSKQFMPIAAAAAVALCARSACSTTVQELVRIKGHEEVVLTGMGIVIGLNGTGDTSKASLVAARPFARLLTNLGNPVEDATELIKADAFAIVSVTMRVPATGARDGDRLPVFVDKLYNAESLEGGRLVTSLLRLPGPDTADRLPMAFAEGPLVVETSNPGSALIRRGGQMIQDVRAQPIAADGTLTLVLENQYAGFPVATTIAGAINDEFALDGLSDIAVVEDAKNIRIHVPNEDRSRPAAFIATLMTIPIDPSLIQTKARIVVNERAGIITVTGDVEIGPVAITHRGMQLSNIAAAPAAGVPPLPPDPNAPPTNPRRWVGMDTTDGASRRSTRLTDLLAALDQLNVPTEDQIAIVFELRKTGALHAEIIGR